MLRNFAGPSSTGVRLLLERTLKLGFGASILATIPLLVTPLHSTFAPWAAACGAAAAGAKAPGAGAAAPELSPVEQNLITIAVLGACGWPHGKCVGSPARA